MIDYRSLVSEIESGLKNESSRLQDSRDNRRFADGHFEEYPTRVENASGERADYRRTTRLFGRIADVLTQHLYKRPPTRTIANHPQATEWLRRLYRRRAVDAKWAEADRLTVIGDVAALQFAGSDDPASPLLCHLWPADQLVVWTDPDDPTEAEAVATLDFYDASRRLTLWTEETRATFVTPKQGATQTQGGTAWRLVREEPNPYRTADGSEGLLPFAFAHFRFPTTDFWQGGPGNGLRRFNDHVNYRLDSSGDALRFSRFPIGVASGTDPSWTPPTQVKPGMFLRLPGDPGDAAGNGQTQANLSYLTPPLGWVESDWMDLNSYIDRCLEDEGIPPGTIRLSNQATSGVQLIVEQAPLLAWAEARRVPFGRYEERAAKTAIAVAASHLRNNGRPDAMLEAAAADPDFALGMHWAPLYVQLPGPERDRTDEWRLEMGFASKLQLLMEREDLTREQALEQLRQVQADNAELLTLGVEPGKPLPILPPPLAGNDPTNRGKAVVPPNPA